MVCRACRGRRQRVYSPQRSHDDGLVPSNSLALVASLVWPHFSIFYTVQPKHQVSLRVPTIHLILCCTNTWGYHGVCSSPGAARLWEVWPGWQAYTHKHTYTDTHTNTHGFIARPHRDTHTHLDRDCYVGMCVAMGGMDNCGVSRERLPRHTTCTQVPRCTAHPTDRPTHLTLTGRRHPWSSAHTHT